jgi:hypothetical protein
MSRNLSSLTKIDCHENQMRRTAILRVNFQDERFSRLWVTGPAPHNPPFAFILFEDEWSCLNCRGRLWKLGERDRRNAASQENTTTSREIPQLHNASSHL